MTDLSKQPSNWYVYERKSYYGITDRRSGIQIAQSGYSRYAARIVQCVNAHDELVALLRETLQPGAYGIGSTLADRIDAALSKANGETK